MQPKEKLTLSPEQIDKIYSRSPVHSIYIPKYNFPNNRTVTYVAVICFFLSLTKGWGTVFLFLPSTFLFLPIFVTMQRKAIERLESYNDLKLQIIRVTHLILFLSLYITASGAGDTDEISVFGFFTTHYGTMISKINECVFLISLFSLIITTLIMLIILCTHHNSMTNSNQ